MYLRQPQRIRVTAYKNGSTLTFTKVTASNIATVMISVFKCIHVKYSVQLNYFRRTSGNNKALLKRGFEAFVVALKD